MKSFFISPLIGYYEGDRANAVDQEVPQRPSSLYAPTFDAQGKFLAWVEDAAKKTIFDRLATDEEERQQARIDNAILTLINATPAGRITWARNNFPSLTLEEQNRIGMILNILAVAVRPQVRRS